MSSYATSSSARVAISGKSGCGNSTVTRLVGTRLGLRVINYTFKNMAEELGISFDELSERAERDDVYDRTLDHKQVELSAAPGCVLGSRLAIWLLEDADLKVYLDGSAEVRAARIAKREGIGYREALEATVARDDRDRRRYLRIYGIDIDRFELADLVVDTTLGDQEYVAEAIVRALEERLGGRRGRRR